MDTDVESMADYREIYNDVFERESRYNLAENSPGLRAVIKASDLLGALYGRSLDIGCGVGFAIEYLAGPGFDLHTFGVDVSDVSIERARQRLDHLPGINSRLQVSSSQSLPFDDKFFMLVTCFDVLEHLDVDDIDDTLAEVERVLKPGGLFFCSVSCRDSGMVDLHGNNLHRTVRSMDWWVERLAPDRIESDVHRSQLTLWKRCPLKTDRRPKPTPTFGETVHLKETGKKPDAKCAADLDSAQLYQQIYDENPWYGNADEGRCPGVRLLPQFKDWLVGPVLDLGCGRGQTVKELQSRGFEAEGIDQVKINSAMRVGDITRPIAGIEQFKSVICIDCIEHLYDDQVIGLFENMKRVERQAFSVHNGESTGTGLELHINRKSFAEWDTLIRQHFDIAAVIKIHEEQMLYLTATKKERSDT